MPCDRSDHPGTGRVVSLAPVGANPDAAALAKLVAYWRQLRRDGDVPRRSEIDPRRIGALISNAFIVERVAPGMARLRLAGSHLSDALGMEVRGMPLSALFQPAHRDDLADGLVHLFDEPAMLRFDLRAHPAYGSALDATMVMLPLRSDLGDISRALGCVVTRGTLGRAPHRFEIASRTVTPLRVTAPPAPCPAPGPAHGFAEPPARFPARPRKAPRERPYLRLVK
ncbi:PAS domain-containing protein [Roseovarius sp. SCSIO 43702]|uniref:PAS domain-containing protein n=1 Tax=Roseovarius sp. SCSIO 43702 TaxID=2823043 RepID=UPI001C732C00|nr:PAS domain-containing protein [Roseovarius sp. SCSIO 43702]QYX55385.1 PAS domain-containing protein [Roseovarius sp. SCSIO 43702]